MAGGKWYETFKNSIPATPATTTPEAAAPVAAAPRPVAVKPPTVKPPVVPTAKTPVVATRKREKQFEELPEGGFAAVLRGPEEEPAAPAPVLAPFDAYKKGVLPPGAPEAGKDERTAAGRALGNAWDAVTKVEGQQEPNKQYTRAAELKARAREIEQAMGVGSDQAVELLARELVEQKTAEIPLSQYGDPESKAGAMFQAKEFIRQQEKYRQSMDSTAARMPYWNEAKQIADSLMLEKTPAAKLTPQFVERFTDYQLKQSGLDKLRETNEAEYEGQRRIAQQNAYRAVQWLQASGNPFATSDITPVTVESIKEAKEKKGTLAAVAETARVLAPKRSVTTSGQVVRAESIPSYLFDTIFNAGGMAADLVTSTTGVDPIKPIWEAKNLKEVVSNVSPLAAVASLVTSDDKRSGTEIAQDVLDTVQYRRTPSMRYSENPEVQAALQSDSPEVWVPAWSGYLSRMGAEMFIPGAEGKVLSSLGKTMNASQDFYRFGKKSIDDITAIKTSRIPKNKQSSAIKDAIILNAQEQFPVLARKLDVPVEQVRARIVAERISNIADQGDVAGAFAAASDMTPEYRTKYADVLMANFADLDGGDNLLAQAGINKSEGIEVLTDADRVRDIATKLEDSIAKDTPELERANGIIKADGDELRRLDEAIRTYSDAGNRPPPDLKARRDDLVDAIKQKSEARAKIRTRVENATAARDSLDNVDEMLISAHRQAAETLREAAGGPVRAVVPIPPALKPEAKDISKKVFDEFGELIRGDTARRLETAEDLDKLLVKLRKEGSDALSEKYINDILTVARQRTPAVDALLRRFDDLGVTDPIDRMRAILKMNPDQELVRAANAAKRMTDAEISRLKAEEAAAELLAATDATKDAAAKLKPVTQQMRQKLGKRLAVQQAIIKAEAAKTATTAEEVGAAVAEDVVGAPKIEDIVDEDVVVKTDEELAPAEAPTSPEMADNNAAMSMGDADASDAQAQVNAVSDALDAQTRVRMGLSPNPVVARQQVQRFGSLPRSYSRGLSNEPFLRPDLVFTNAGRIPASELPPSAADHLFRLAENRAYNNIWSYAMGADDVALSIQKSYVDAAEQISGLEPIAKALREHPAAAERAERAAKQFSQRVGVPYVPKRVTQKQFRDGMKKYFDEAEKARDPSKPIARGMNEYYRSLLQRSNPDKTLPVDAVHYGDMVVVHSADAAERAGPLSRYVQYVDDSSGLEVSRTGTVKTIGPDFVGRVVGETVADDGTVKLLVEPHEFTRGDARYSKAEVQPIEVDPEVLGYYERGRTTDLFVGRGVASKDVPLGRKFGINKQSPRPLLEEEWAEINKAHQGSKALGKVKYNQTSGMSKLDNFFDELGPPDRPTKDAFTISADDLAALPENIREPVKRALSKPEFFLEEGVEAAAKKVEAPRAPAPVEAKPAAAVVPAPATAPTKLTTELAGAKPKFNIGKASYSPQFESDIDKALYIVAQTKQSARHDDYLQFLRDATGMTTDEIAVAAGMVRAELKKTLKGKPEGAVDIPTIWKAEAPKATPEQVAKAKPVQQLRVAEGEVPEPPKSDAELDALRAEEQRLTGDIEALKAEAEAIRGEATGRATAGGISDLEKKLAELEDRAQKAGARYAKAQAEAADAKDIAESASGVRAVLEESFSEVRKAKADILGEVQADAVGKELRFRQAIAQQERKAALQPGERLANLRDELAGISKAQTAAYRESMDGWFGGLVRGARGVDRFFSMLGTDTIEATEELLSGDYREINRQMEVMAKEADLEIDKALSRDLEAIGGAGDAETSLANVLSITEKRGYGDTWRMSSGSGSILQGTMDRVAAAYLDYASVDKIVKGDLDTLREIVLNHDGSLPDLADKLYAATKNLVGVKMTARGAGDVIFTQNITRQAAVSDAFRSLYGLGAILGPEDATAVKEYLAGTKVSDRGRAIALTYLKQLVGDNALITEKGDFTTYINPQDEALFTQVGLSSRKIDDALDSVDRMFKTDIYIPAPIRRKMSDIMTAPQNFTRRDWQSSAISIWKQGTLFGSGFGPARAEFFTDNLFQTMDAIGVQQGLAQGARAVVANSLKTVLMSRVGPAATTFVDSVRYLAGQKAIRPGQTSREAMEQVSRFEEVLAGGHIGTETTAVLNAEDTVIDGFGGMTGRDLWRIATKRGVGEGVGTDLLVRQLEDALETGPVGRLGGILSEGLTRSAGYIEQRKRFGLFMTRTQMLIDEAKATSAADIAKLADQAAREVTEAMLNYEISLHPFERSFWVQVWMPFLAFEKSNTTRVAKQITNSSTVTAFAARLGRLYRGKTAVTEAWSKWADPTDEYGFDAEAMQIDDEQRPEGEKVYPKYVAALEELKAGGVTPGFVRYQWADTSQDAKFDALAPFATYYAAPPPNFTVPDYGQKKFSAVANAGRLNSLDAYQGAMKPKSEVDRSTHATFTTLWADGNLDAFTKPIALAELLGLIGMKMAGTVDPQVNTKMLQAFGRMAGSPLDTAVGGALADVFSAGMEKPTSFTQPIRLSQEAGVVLEKVGAPVTKVSKGQYVNDEGTMIMEDGYYVNPTANAMTTLLPLIAGRYGAPFARGAFTAREWSAFDDKFIDQLYYSNNPKQGRKLALDYMIGLRSGDIDVRKAEETLTRKYLGELTKPFPGGEAAGAVRGVTPLGQQAAATSEAATVSDKQMTDSVITATSGLPPVRAGDETLRAFLLKRGVTKEELNPMSTQQVYELVSNMPEARKLARETAARPFLEEQYDAGAVSKILEVTKRKATSATWTPESIATMRFALSTPMPGNDYARFTPEQVDQMTADQVRKELMK